MAYGTFGPRKGNRAATIAKPGSKGKTRPTAQKGGGGNKAAGSPEPTAATTPTVTVHSDGSVTAEHFAPSKAGEVAAAAAVARQKAREAHVQRVVALVTSKPDRKPVVAKGTTKAKAPSPSSKPATFEGKKTAGTPTLASLEKAQTSGTLKTNKAGFLTTPAVREASQSVAKARRQVAKTTGVTGPLTTTQKKIAKLVSKETGGVLKPRTVATQELQEMSGSAAQQRDAERNFNTLNIGYYDSGPGQLTKDPTWSNPKSAAKATAEFFKGERYGPSAKIAAILPKAKGKSVKQQLRIIGNSGWATSNYGPDLQATSRLVGEKRNPRAEAKLKAAVEEAKGLGLKVTADGRVNVGPPPKKLVKRTVVAERAMREVEGTPYVWGGGHGAFTATGGLDCSGAVSYVLHKVEPNVLKAPLTSGSMGQVLKPGPGALTVFYNAEHTFLRLINREGEAEYWGTSVGDSGAGGLTRHPTPSSSYLAKYNVGHVPGMGKKQALQLGAVPGSLTGGSPESFPGMTFSPSGTTATIDSGAGTTVSGKPGFSKKPIMLAGAPIDAEAALANLSLKGGKEAGEPSASSELTRKYGGVA